jgi:hypothetical protein
LLVNRCWLLVTGCLMLEFLIPKSALDCSTLYADTLPERINHQ